MCPGRPPLRLVEGVRFHWSSVQLLLLCSDCIVKGNPSREQAAFAESSTLAASEVVGSGTRPGSSLALLWQYQTTCWFSEAE